MVGPAELFEVGKRYEVSFQLPGHKTPYHLRGITVYATLKGVGMRFEAMSAEVTAEFRAFVDQQGAAMAR